MLDQVPEPGLRIVRAGGTARRKMVAPGGGQRGLAGSWDGEETSVNRGRGLARLTPRAVLWARGRQGALGGRTWGGVSPLGPIEVWLLGSWAWYLWSQQVHPCPAGADLVSPINSIMPGSSG